MKRKRKRKRKSKCIKGPIDLSGVRIDESRARAKLEGRIYEKFSFFIIIFSSFAPNSFLDLSLFFFFFVSINPRHFFGKDCLSDESMSNPSHRGSKKRGIKTLSGMMTPTQADVKRDVFGGRSTPTPPIDFFFC